MTESALELYQGFHERSLNQGVCFFCQRAFLVASERSAYESSMHALVDKIPAVLSESRERHAAARQELARSNAPVESTRAAGDRNCTDASNDDGDAVRNVFRRRQAEVATREALEAEVAQRRDSEARTAWWAREAEVRASELHDASCANKELRRGMVELEARAQALALRCERFEAEHRASEVANAELHGHAAERARTCEELQMRRACISAELTQSAGRCVQLEMVEESLLRQLERTHGMHSDDIRQRAELQTRLRHVLAEAERASLERDELRRELVGERAARERFEADAIDCRKFALRSRSAECCLREELNALRARRSSEIGLAATASVKAERHRAAAAGTAAWIAATAPLVERLCDEGGELRDRLDCLELQRCEIQRLRRESKAKYTYHFSVPATAVKPPPTSLTMRTPPRLDVCPPIELLERLGNSGRALLQELGSVSVLGIPVPPVPRQAGTKGPLEQTAKAESVAETLPDCDDDSPSAIAICCGDD
jgi:hypothetical protein